MNANTKTTMEITLIKLTAEEAIWLKGLVQNPQCHPCEESAENAEMRASLFNALPSFPDLYRANVKVHTPLPASASDETEVKP
jgi:hypothetical protein